ncbi:MAG: hypothetical protein FJ125_18300, partial [Deltaproteobacteria bacterium]|nr:hypothetical protein [Deltaproteobacteria bacterium]
MPTRLSTLLLSFLAAGLLAQPAGADPGGEGAPAEGAWVIWYRHPADKWEHAFPAGNGRLGAMVFGGVERERIQLNEDTLWAGYPRDRQNPRAFEALAEVRRLLFEGKNNEAADLAA